MFRVKTKPPTVNNSALDVKLGMYLESLGNFRSTEMVSAFSNISRRLHMWSSWLEIVTPLEEAANKMFQSFDVDLYVYMSWKDTRLAHNESDYVLINDDEIRKKIW